MPIKPVFVFRKHENKGSEYVVRTVQCWDWTYYNSEWMKSLQLHKMNLSVPSVKELA